jgi:hypothetical protein
VKNDYLLLTVLAVTPNNAKSIYCTEYGLRYDLCGMLPLGFGHSVSIYLMFLDEQPFQLQGLLERP